jgi:curved DNA-binding protein
MEFKDYYKTLGVAKTASEKEIKQAFRKLARKLHPDVNPGDKAAEARFKEVNEAYEVLGDPSSRKKYDELGANWRMYEQAGAQAGGPFGGFNVGGTGGRSGFRTMSQEEMEELFGDSNPFSDFFTTFFGGGMGGAGTSAGRVRQRAGRDIENEIELSLEDAYHGATQRLALTAGPRPARASGSAAHDRGARRRSGCADALRQAGEAAHSAADAERTGVSLEGIWHAGGGQG